VSSDGKFAVAASNANLSVIDLNNFSVSSVNTNNDYPVGVAFIPYNTTKLFPCDMDNNGVDEIVKIDEYGNIYFLVGLKTWYQIPGTLQELYCGDINLDYKTDIVGLNNGSIYYSLDASKMWTIVQSAYNKNLYSANLAGSLTWQYMPGALQKINIADLKGKGISDIFGLNNAGDIYVNFSYTDWQTISGSLANIYAGNFNLGRNGNEMAGLNNAGSIYYTNDLASWINIPGTLAQLATGDVDGDGKGDIIGINTNNNVYYTTNLSTWQNIPGTLSYIATGDFDGDYDIDIIGLNGSNLYYTTNLSTWTNIPGGLTSFIVGDFNSDGKSDVAGIGLNGKIYYTTNLTTWTQVN